VTDASPSAGFRSTAARVGSPVCFNSTSTFAWTPLCPIGGTSATATR
jgi:hypothetical protein